MNFFKAVRGLMRNDFFRVLSHACMITTILLQWLQACECCSLSVELFLSFGVRSKKGCFRSRIQAVIDCSSKPLWFKRLISCYWDLFWITFFFRNWFWEKYSYMFFFFTLSKTKCKQIRRSYVISAYSVEGRWGTGSFFFSIFKSCNFVCVFLYF